MNGSISAYTHDNFLIRIDLKQHISTGEAVERLEEVNVCVGTETASGLCYLVPPQLGDHGWYIPIPAAGTEGMVRLTLCTTTECGPTFNWGRVTVDATGAFYAVSDPRAGTFRLSVFSLKSNATYVDLALDDGQTKAASCTGISTCISQDFTSNAQRATITLTLLGAPSRTSTVPVQ